MKSDNFRIDFNFNISANLLLLNYLYFVKMRQIKVNKIFNRFSKMIRAFQFLFNLALIKSSVRVFEDVLVKVTNF